MRRATFWAIAFSIGVLLAAPFAVIVWLLWVVFPDNHTWIQEGADALKKVLGNSPSRLQSFVFAYQTLIGGALAILAAMMTVLAMIAVDRGQAKRHNQLVELTVREDKRRFERLMVPQFRILRETQKTLKIAGNKIIPLPRGGNAYAELVAHVGAVAAAAESIGDCLGEQAWKMGEDLFDGALTFDCRVLDALSHHTGILRTEILAHIDRINYSRGSRTPTAVDEGEAKEIADFMSMLDHASDKIAHGNAVIELQRAVAKFADATSDLSDRLNTVMDRLRKMAGDYGIKEEHIVTPLPNRLSPPARSR